MAATFTYPTFGNFSYENNNKSINVFDVLYVQYRSAWPSLNLTLFCADSSTSGNYQYLNVPGNPILASGLYEFGTIDSAGFDIPQYPTTCSFKLTEFGDNDSSAGGEDFTITSDDAASPKTFMPTSSTTASVQSATTTGHMVLETTSMSTSQTHTSSSAPTPIPSLSQTSQPTGLSTGAKAGIGVGATLGGLALLALVGFFAWKRGKKHHAAGPTPSQAEMQHAPTVTAYGQNQWTKPGVRHDGSQWSAERTHELNTSSPTELDATSKPFGHEQRYEL